VFGRAELLQRLMVVAAAGPQHAVHNVYKQPDVSPGVCLQGPHGALKPPLGQPDAGRPPFRPLVQQRRADLGQGYTRSAEQLTCFALGEAQIFRADLG
jgi:hypothetical protein